MNVHTLEPATSPGIAAGSASGQQKAALPQPSQKPSPGESLNSPGALWRRKSTVIAALSVLAILAHHNPASFISVRLTRQPMACEKRSRNQEDL